MSALSLLFVFSWLWCSTLGAVTSDGSILFMSSEGLHQIFVNGSGFRTIVPLVRKFDGSSILPPNTGGLCVDSEKEIAFWSSNDPVTYTRKLFAIDVRRDSVNPQPVELASSGSVDFLGCATNPTQSILYYALFDSGAFGIKISAVQYDGPDNIQIIKPASQFPSPGIRVKAVEGGALAVFGSVVYCTIFDDTGDIYVTQVDMSGAGQSLDPLIKTAPEIDTFYSSLAVDQTNRILYILESPYTNFPTSLFSFDLVGLTLSKVWANSDISITASGQQVGSYASTITIIGDDSDYIAYVKSGTPSALSDIYIKNMKDMTEPETLLYSASGGMISVSPGISPITWMSSPPQIDPPVEPPMNTDAPDTMQPAGTTAVPETNIPTDVPTGVPPPPPAPPRPPPPPPRAIPTQPPPTTPQDFVCSDVVGITDCRAHADLCDWDVTTSTCTEINCVGLGETSCGKLLSACLWKNKECISLPPCTTLSTDQDCTKLDGCTWIRNICTATAALEDGSADDSAVSLFVIVIIGSIAFLILCVTLVLCCAISLRKKMNGKDKKDPEEESNDVSLQHRSRTKSVASPSLMRAERQLRDNQLIPPIMKKSDIFGDEGQSDDEADYIALKNCGLDSAAFASKDGGRNPTVDLNDSTEMYHVNAVLGSLEGHESKREMELKDRVASAREALVTIQRQGDLIIENESRNNANSLKNSFSEVGDNRSEAGASIPGRRATIVIEDPIVFEESNSTDSAIPLIERGDTQSIAENSLKRKVRHQSASVSGSVATLLRRHES